MPIIQFDLVYSHKSKAGRYRAKLLYHPAIIFSMKLLLSCYFSKQNYKLPVTAATARNTCSTLSRIFSAATSFFIASSKVVTPRTIGKNASIPVALHALASFVTLPAKARTRTPCFFASFATPTRCFAHRGLEVQFSLTRNR